MKHESVRHIRIAASTLFKEPPEMKQQGYSYCEGWGNARYVAVVRLDSGALLSIMGSSAANEFDEALPVFREALKTIKDRRSSR